MMEISFQYFLHITLMLGKELLANHGNTFQMTREFLNDIQYSGKISLVLFHGEARIGKSTLINMVLNPITKNMTAPRTPFKIGGMNDPVTYGINFFTIDLRRLRAMHRLPVSAGMENHRIIFIDTEGTDSLRRESKCLKAGIVALSQAASVVVHVAGNTVNTNSLNRIINEMKLIDIIGTSNSRSYGTTIPEIRDVVMMTKVSFESMPIEEIVKQMNEVQNLIQGQIMKRTKHRSDVIVTPMLGEESSPNAAFYSIRKFVGLISEAHPIDGTVLQNTLKKLFVSSNINSLINCNYLFSQCYKQYLLTILDSQKRGALVKAKNYVSSNVSSLAYSFLRTMTPSNYFGEIRNEVKREYIKHFSSELQSELSAEISIAWYSVEYSISQFCCDKVCSVRDSRRPKTPQEALKNGEGRFYRNGKSIDFYIFNGKPMMSGFIHSEGRNISFDFDKFEVTTSGYIECWFEDIRGRKRFLHGRKTTRVLHESTFSVTVPSYLKIADYHCSDIGLCTENGNSVCVSACLGLRSTLVYLTTI